MCWNWLIVLASLFWKSECSYKVARLKCSILCFNRLAFGPSNRKLGTFHFCGFSLFLLNLQYWTSRFVRLHSNLTRIETPSKINAELSAIFFIIHENCLRSEENWILVRCLSQRNWKLHWCLELRAPPSLVICENKPFLHVEHQFSNLSSILFFVKPIITF